jgi:hypothetical protein
MTMSWMCSSSRQAYLVNREKKNLATFQLDCAPVEGDVCPTLENCDLGFGVQLKCRLHAW